ncbi:MAG: hypothetical protein H7145_06650 [Akkermansiaceae bacterium]|nr:hypothetical protein [Armatimonadota bacterium]
MALRTVQVWSSGYGTFIYRVQNGLTASVRPWTPIGGATITEFRYQPYGAFMGQALMRVCNVSPGNGFVDVRVEIGWNSYLVFQLTLLLDAP